LRNIPISDNYFEKGALKLIENGKSDLLLEIE
jgi:hypothetical protein